MVPEQSHLLRKDLPAEATVLKWSLCCRLFALLLQIILNALVVDYDSSACCLGQPGASGRLEVPLGGMRRWDAVYFLRIAEHGYEYEQNSAFFPAWPLTVRAVADFVLSPLAPVLSRSDRLLVSAALTGTVFFCAAAVFLFRLSLRVTRDRRLSLCAALLFCLNPAVVFFHAAYSTSMFACLSFWAMLRWHCGQRWRSAAVMALLCGVRSNGVLTCGFVAYEFGYRWLRDCASGTVDARRVARLALDALAAALRVAVICSPLLAYQAVIYDMYCGRAAFTLSRPPPPGADGAAPVDSALHPYPVRPGWCSSVTGMAYGHVQSQYWNVGFLRYFEAKQIPNFALASPVLLLTAVFAVTYARRTWRQVLELKLDEGYGLWSPRVFVFAVHWIAFVALCFLNIHIQVLTRLVASATPVFYWYSADLFLGDQTPTEESSDNQAEYRRKPLRQAASKTSNGASYFIILYFLVYAYLGLALHTNFYPWT